MSDGLNFLSAVLEHGSVSSLREVEDAHFIDEDELGAYHYVLRHLQQHRALPLRRTLETECGVELENAGEPVDYYRERIYNRLMYVRAREHFGELRDTLARNNTQGIMDAIAALQSAVLATRTQADLQELEVADDQIMRRLRRRSSSMLDDTGILTGWDPIDDETGGYRNGDLVGWIGRPSMGKTYLLLYQALSAWLSGRSVLFVSMEMPIEAISTRLIGLRSGVDSRLIRLNRLSNAAMARIEEALGSTLGYSPFQIFAGNFGRTTADIATLMTEHTPDVVFVDGVYRLRPIHMPRNGSRYEMVANVLDELKGMTIQHNRPIVYSSQFNREAGAGGKSGSLENIGFTDAASQHSSLLYAIRPWERHRDNRINLDVDPKSVRVIETMKGREGESAHFVINYGFQPVNFAVNPNVWLGCPPDHILEQSTADRTDYMISRPRN